MRIVSSYVVLHVVASACLINIVAFQGPSRLPPGTTFSPVWWCVSL